MKYRTGIGQDSHRFLTEETMKPCVLGGLIFEDVPGFHANSDGDVIFHALTNAISSLSGEIILGVRSDELLQTSGITDSGVYLKEALKTLKNQKIVHVALSIEGQRPRITPKAQELRQSIAHALEIDISQVGLTATTGEGLTDFGFGDGVQCFCVLTTLEK